MNGDYSDRRCSLVEITGGVHRQLIAGVLPISAKHCPSDWRRSRFWGCATGLASPLWCRHWCVSVLVRPRIPVVRLRSSRQVAVQRFGRAGVLSFHHQVGIGGPQPGSIAPLPEILYRALHRNSDPTAEHEQLVVSRADPPGGAPSDAHRCQGFTPSLQSILACPRPSSPCRSLGLSARTRSKQSRLRVLSPCGSVVRGPSSSRWPGVSARPWSLTPSACQGPVPPSVC